MEIIGYLLSFITALVITIVAPIIVNRLGLIRNRPKKEKRVRVKISQRIELKIEEEFFKVIGFIAIFGILSLILSYLT